MAALYMVTTLFVTLYALHVQRIEEDLAGQEKFWLMLCVGSNPTEVLGIAFAT